GQSNMLFVSFTFDPKDYSVGEAWTQLPKAFVAWKARMVRAYGKFTTFRCWERQQNGYPHAHALLVFEDHHFDIFKLGPKWRVSDRDERDQIAAWWGEGFVDVQGVTDPVSGFNYVAKYVSGRGKGKDPHPSPYGGPRMDLGTLSVCWLLKMRQWAVSGVNLIHRCLTITKPTRKYLTSAGETVVGELCWRFQGAICLLMKGTKPPPEAIDLNLCPDLQKAVVRAFKPMDGGYRW
ncbi:unnamed protein product, partial [marine sediment metagenome]